MMWVYEVQVLCASLVPHLVYTFTELVRRHLNELTFFSANNGIARPNVFSDLGNGSFFVYLSNIHSVKDGACVSFQRIWRTVVH